MATGIKDKVAIIGMGCSKFGERWDMGAEELIVEAFVECLEDAKIEKNDIQAAWFGSCIAEVNVGSTAMPLARSLRLPHIPVTRVENACATGTEAFRGACYAVASGAYDIVLAQGQEKLKDTGYGGLPAGGGGTKADMISPNTTAPGNFAQLASAYRARYGYSRDELKLALANISWKSHQNGAINPKAHLRKPIAIETILNAPMIADPLGLFDCCGVSDGSACAIVTTPEIAKDLGHKKLLTVKALAIAVSNGYESAFNEWKGDHFVTADKAADMAYAEAGIKNPREEISMMEVHDCFSITELVTMEDLKISARGEAVKDINDGFYNLDGGGVPCQPDGGLKCFGHPIGASGLRMLYEMYLQLHGRAGERQIENPIYGLTHNLGGSPRDNVCSVAIIGQYR
ncbi:MAG: acetyl-CoA acetyltransferase [Deltaproteobacteria bacterium]|nr:acetyl-CoA acetyltransferase [Deltaproteobacteria bacterium]MBW2053698.1 acetyl-CoA acetyltransferase [Deltaproteobacteria bacterium]MBW2141653.1 acetyl-CoA acetyltransferase [Deltaproteobacteria bacterium]MBW2323533.1 acetyl-CoA acetyltransferase [Deltaproteobacteria bacterium]